MPPSYKKNDLKASVVADSQSQLIANPSTLLFNMALGVLSVFFGAFETENKLEMLLRVDPKVNLLLQQQQQQQQQEK